MKIDIWSDIVCPFCYIGKRHLELALEQFEHADSVEIVWHSFELDPKAPQNSSQSIVEHIAHKYQISMEQSEASQRDIAARAAAVGLTFNWEIAQPGNTFDAHRLIHLGKAHGLEGSAEEAFIKAYFTQGRAIGDPAVLKEIALELGLPEEEIDEVLKGDKFAHAVRADERVAAELGISGVPFFLLENQWVINGAQPVETILAGLQQVWNETHQAKAPQLLKVPGAEGGKTCGPEGC